jgi:hypothetical protein
MYGERWVLGIGLYHIEFAKFDRLSRQLKAS